MAHRDTESSEVNHPNRLGQFFIEWGVRLTASCVDGYCRPTTRIAVYVDGYRYEGNAAAIQLIKFKESAAVIGVPSKHIPASYDFSDV